jgi:hypothetical protein
MADLSMGQPIAVTATWTAYSFTDATQRGRGCLVLCGSTPNEVIIDWDGGSAKARDETVENNKNFLSSTGILSHSHSE